MERNEPAVRRLRELETLPAHAPACARNLWELARHGSEPTLEEEAKALSMLDHPEFTVLADFADDLPDEFVVGGVNPRMHLIMHQILETQLIQNDPPEVALALEHLIGIGVSRHRGCHLILDGFAEEFFKALKRQRPWDPGPYQRHLEALMRAKAGGTVIPFDKRPGRNDPCPCGSGKKYKKCHGPQEEGGVSVSVALPRGRLLLSPGIYATEEHLLTVADSDPLLYLENLAAVAAALDEAGADVAAAAAYRQLVASAEEAAIPEVLEGALQDQQLFAMDHAEHAADGISATERLLEMTDDPDQIATYRLDLADLHDLLGRRDTADRIYQEVIAGAPSDPYAYLRWARRQAGAGDAQGAAATYRRLIDSRLADEVARRTAAKELADLLGS